jgi:hypothetical protein
MYQILFYYLLLLSLLLYAFYQNLAGRQRRQRDFEEYIRLFSFLYGSRSFPFRLPWFVLHGRFGMAVDIYQGAVDSMAIESPPVFDF